MKKLHERKGINLPFLKFDLKMKLTALLVFTSFFNMLASTGYSQVITLDAQNTTVEKIIDKIEVTSKYAFVYNRKFVDLQRKVSIKVKDVLIETVLSKLFDGTKTSYEVIDTEIFLKERIVLKERVDKSSSSIMPQEFEIKGTVNDNDDQPLPGANIFEKGTTNGTQTDFDGMFSLKVTDGNATLVISYLGFLSQEVAINSQTSLTITLQEDAAKLDEVVVVGYGTSSVKKLTGSISSLKTDQIADVPIASIDQGLAGQMAGVNIIQASGDPGGDPSFKIRGAGSVQGDGQPLIVVDGFPLSSENKLNNISPSEIASIDVLKDASSAAIYGSRGANGVILITTKKGSIGQKPKFDFKVYSGLQSVANKIELMDAYEYAQYRAEGFNNAWIRQNPGVNSPNDPNQIRTSRYRIPEYLFPYLDGQTGLVNTDWQDEIFRVAQINNYQMSVTGGGSNSRYFISGNYFNQEGIIQSTDFSRFTLRANFETNFSKKIKFGVNLNPSYSKANKVSDENYSNDGVVLTALVAHPFTPAYNDDGSLAISLMTTDKTTSQQENPLALAKLIEQYETRQTLMWGTFLEFNLLEGLKFKTSIGGEFISRKDNKFRPTALGGYKKSPISTQSIANLYNQQTINWTNENILTYKKRFGDKHNLDVLLGYTIQKEEWEKRWITARDFPNDDIHTANLALETSATSQIQEWSLISYLSRVKYDYGGKYLLSASLRRDGSSRFGKNSKWGYFPAVSLGWRVSNEKFFPKSKVVSDIKLRASWGETGNFEIPNYASIALLNEDNYAFGDASVQGLYPNTSPNGDLTWETTKTIDLGFDAELFEGKIQLSADVYKSTINGMLLNAPVPTQSGYNSSFQNIGSSENKGLEVSLYGDFKFGEVKWKPSLNYSTNKNKLLYLTDDQTEIRGWQFSTEVGQPIGSFWGYNVTGVVKTQADIDNNPQITDAEIGRSYIFEDTNGDGVLNSADKVLLGSHLPDFTFGFTNSFEYRSFDLSFILQGAIGHEIFNYTRLWTLNQGVWSPNLREITNTDVYVTPDIERTKTNNNYNRSSLLIEDASFVRIRNISLGYKLPKEVLSKIGISNGRFYISATNPFTFTNYSGYNPEVSSRKGNPLQPGIDYGNAPIARTYTLGVNFSF